MKYSRANEIRCVVMSVIWKCFQVGPCQVELGCGTQDIIEGTWIDLSFILFLQHFLPQKFPFPTACLQTFQSYLCSHNAQCAHCLPSKKNLKADNGHLSTAVNPPERAAHPPPSHRLTTFANALDCQDDRSAVIDFSAAGF